MSTVKVLKRTAPLKTGKTKKIIVPAAEKNVNSQSTPHYTALKKLHYMAYCKAHIHQVTSFKRATGKIKMRDDFHPVK